MAYTRYSIYAVARKKARAINIKAVLGYRRRRALIAPTSKVNGRVRVTVSAAERRGSARRCDCTFFQLRLGRCVQYKFNRRFSATVVIGFSFRAVPQKSM